MRARWASAGACWLLGLAMAQAQSITYRQDLPSSPEFAARVNAVEIEFEQAETPQAYRQAREHAVRLVADADKANQPAAAFAAAVIAADCTYFTTRIQSQSQDQHWALNELSDLAEAAKHRPSAPEGFEFERYVELLATTVDHMEMGVLSAVEPKIDALLRLLAKSSEESIPIDFHYRALRKRGQGFDQDIRTKKALAQLSYRFGSTNVAQARLATAALMAKEAGEAELWLDVEHERYMNERHANRFSPALASWRAEARTGQQGLRELYSSRAGRIWIDFRFDQMYGQMLQDQLSSQDPGTNADIFRVCEALKARMLLDELSAPPVELSPGDRPAAESMESKVLGFAPGDRNEDDIWLQEMNLLSQLSPFGPLGGQPGEREGLLAQLEQIYQKNSAGFAQAARPAALEDVERALEPKEAILEYVIPYSEFYRDQDLWILLITKGGFRTAHVALDQMLPRNATNTGGFAVDGKAPLQSSPLSSEVVRLREAIRKNNEAAARGYLNEFHQILIQPLVQLGFQPRDFDRVIIVPHGPLHYLPFSALLDKDGKFLIQHTAVSMAPSASIWLLLTRRAGTATHFVGFGNPLLNRPDLPSLNASEAEVTQIANSLALLDSKNKDVYFHERATWQRFLSEAPRGELLHVATHGEFPDDNALDRHAILLAPAASQDGAVRASDVRRLNLKSTQLVMLNICNGGLYRMGPADEPYGLMPAFLRAGSQNVVGTLWKVEDTYGRLLATDLYKNLKSGPSDALRQAMLGLIGDNQMIRRWAGFVTFGPGRPFAIGGK